MLCYAMLCYAMLCYAMLCYAILCYAMLNGAMFMVRLYCNTVTVSVALCVCVPLVGKGVLGWAEEAAAAARERAKQQNSAVQNNIDLAPKLCGGISCSTGQLAWAYHIISHFYTPYMIKIAELYSIYKSLVCFDILARCGFRNASITV